MRVPGATTSGLTAMSNRVGPRELYGATTSSDRSRVPLVSTAPTVSAAGEFPGEVIPPRIGAPVDVAPWFPADATTTMPALTARATARQSGSVAAGSATG